MPELRITLPAAIVSQYGLGTDVLHLAIVEDGKIVGGKRAIQRSYRDSNGSDPGRIKRLEWGFGGERGGIPVGAIGASQFSQAGFLGLDFSQNLESRWDGRLISSIAQTTVTLSGLDPPGTGAYFGTSYFSAGGVGSAYFGSGGIIGQDVIVFDEQSGRLFAHRGSLSTQVNLSTWAVEATQAQDAVVRWAESWYGYGRIALGPSVPMQTRVGVSSSGSMYADTVSVSPPADVYANYVTGHGSDRAWIVDASQAGSTFNNANFTLDSFETMAAPFQVGDPMVGVNGIGPFGPVTSFGSQNQVASFTDQGKPVPLSTALAALLSPVNGQQFANPGFGWNYYISVMGLRAHDLRGNDNPIGIGERMRGFTGHNGIPTAIFAARGELWVVYETSAGNIYGYRGVFGAQTANTGQPLFFPWFYAAATTCGAVFSSTTPNIGTQSLTIVRGSGTNMTYMTIAANGRDDLASTIYSVAGGVGYLTTYDENPNLLRTLRLARVKARGMTSGSSWAVAVGFDTSPTNPTGSTYTTIGTITTDGYKVLTPVSGSAPIAGISGHTVKPRVTQTAAGSGASSTPPELYGTLELEIEERPDQIEAIEVAVKMEGANVSQNMLWTLLQALVGSQTDGPFKIQLPDDLAPAVSTGSGGGQKYGMVEAVTSRSDIKDGAFEAVTVSIQCWPQASPL